MIVTNLSWNVGEGGVGECIGPAYEPVRLGLLSLSVPRDDDPLDGARIQEQLKQNLLVNLQHKHNIITVNLSTGQ